MKRIVIVDTRLWAYQTHHAKQNIMKMFDNVAECYPYDTYTKLVWAFDIGKSKFHTKIYPLYKAHRKEQQSKMSAAEQARLKKFNQDYNKLKEILPYFGTFVGLDGYEADSIANIIVESFQDKYEIILMTDDSDWLVHLNNNVKMVTTKGKVITADSLVDYKGFTAWQLGVYKNLVGETKDRVWGLYRFGEKALRKILDTVGDDEDAILALAQEMVDKKIGGCKIPENYPYEGFSFSTVREMYEFNKTLNEGVRLSNIPQEDLLEIKKQFNVSKQNIQMDGLGMLVTKTYNSFYPISGLVQQFYGILKDE